MTCVLLPLLLLENMLHMEGATSFRATRCPRRTNDHCSSVSVASKISAFIAHILLSKRLALVSGSCFAAVLVPNSESPAFDVAQLSLLEDGQLLSRRVSNYVWRTGSTVTLPRSRSSRLPLSLSRWRCGCSFENASRTLVEL